MASGLIKIDLNGNYLSPAGMPNMIPKPGDTLLRHLRNWPCMTANGRPVYLSAVATIIAC